MGFWDNMATNHLRVMRLAGLIVVLISILMIAVGVADNSTKKLLKTESVIAKVESVTKHDSGDIQTRFGSSNIMIYRGRLRLPDGSTIELVLPQPVPEEGETVPVNIESYDNGEKFFSIDSVEWIMHRSQ